MSKMSKSNFKKENLDKILGVLKSNQVFVDSVIGDDSNDGFSKEQPIKTLTKLSEILSYKSYPGRVHVKLLGGTFLGNLLIKNMDCSHLIINGGTKIAKSILTPHISNETNVGVGVWNCRSAVILENVLIRPTVTDDIDIMNCFVMDCSDVQQFNTESVEIDMINYKKKTLYAIVQTLSSSIHRNLSFINTKADIIYQGGIGSYSALNDLKSDIATTVTLVTGAIGQINSLAEGSAPIHINSGTHEASSFYKGIDLYKLSNSIVEEVGENANGRYIKYANGKIEIYTVGTISFNTLMTQHVMLPAAIMLEAVTQFTPNNYPTTNENENNANWWDNLHHITAHIDDQRRGATLLYRGPLFPDLEGLVYIKVDGRWK